jgi:hypothetical protein
MQLGNLRWFMSREVTWPKGMRVRSTSSFFGLCGDSLDMILWWSFNLPNPEKRSAQELSLFPLTLSFPSFYFLQIISQYKEPSCKT